MNNKATAAAASPEAVIGIMHTTSEPNSVESTAAARPCTSFTQLKPASTRI